MGRIIIIGNWDIIKAYMPYININSVVCFADDSAELKRLYGKVIVRLERIKEFESDYVVIFERENIGFYYTQLKNLGISREKIINWVYYLFFLEQKTTKFSRDAYAIINQSIKQLMVHTLLDIDFGMARNALFIYSRNVQDNLRYIDNYGKKSFLYGVNNYKNIYETLDLTKRYDAVCCLDFYLNHSLTELYEMIEVIRGITRYIFISLPFKCFGIFDEWTEMDFSMYGKVAVFHMELSKLVVIDTYDCNEVNEEVKIFTVTHKEFVPPKNNIYIPIHAGKSSNNMSILRDDIGDSSIAELNPYINECTALYWIWKNTTDKYIGLNHYRRFFCIGKYWGESEQNLLDSKNIKIFLNKYDMIVAEACDFYPRTISEALKESVNPDAYQKAYTATKKIIIKKYPEYKEDYDRYFNGYVSNLCNMFITRREILNKYCEWLFSIILEVVEKLPLDSYDSYSKRIVGFIAERLLTLWIIHNDISVKELPILFIKK
ncbi:DUF4422 domain-containing protein [Parablautia intestinalis]|uniref:DUF4422 domain-containing protein n=1 Tax=Parablautia intestinalis TaxID=2320100 RepID=A0A3A9AB53_9FIRM|nr:DUF4422 domain-containing protein [Parablautia intestinalis]RKI88669.1 DUF4422 domain-containing protein [Parablautia intestinalis]